MALALAQCQKASNAMILIPGLKLLFGIPNSHGVEQYTGYYRIHCRRRRKEKNRRLKEQESAAEANREGTWREQGRRWRVRLQEYKKHNTKLLILNGGEELPEHNLRHRSGFGYHIICVPADKEKKGIIALAFTFKHGLIVAADHPRGSVDNLIKVSDRLVVIVSGEIAKGGGGISVDEATTRVASTLSSSNVTKDSEGLPIGVPVLYHVNGKGEVLQGNGFAVGSSHDLAFGFMQLCHDMSIDEAIEVGRRAICMGAMGAKEYCGFASAYHVGADGKWTMVVDNEDMKDLLEMKYKLTLLKLDTTRACPRVV
ncbi:OLC1v1030286C1 [Oldenlandia corymbosa var. corymbosa]|uniref:OLC1v1030286C1 n=1 Tax=Oldenlandia corymbosa var. corymbosa TaxID=529605 RepID=A0AAV1CIQ7_OLDCO|nr:OLC1v1030286C1 [Oldenlandia corymbosa var. corymbosa]